MRLAKTWGKLSGAVLCANLAFAPSIVVAQPAPTPEPPLPVASPPSACGLHVSAIGKNTSNGVVRFVLSSTQGSFEAADIAIVTTHAMYGSTLHDVSPGTPLALTVPDAAGLRGVYVTGDVDRAGVKQDCGIGDGYPPGSLPYLRYLPYDASLDRLGDGSVSAPVAATMIVQYPDYIACEAPFRKVQISGRASIPQYPKNATASGEVEVVVSIDDSGKVVRSRISESSGSLELDRAAVDAAMQTKFLPSLSKCLPVSDEYTLTAVFFCQ